MVVANVKSGQTFYEQFYQFRVSMPQIEDPPVTMQIKQFLVSIHIGQECTLTVAHDHVHTQLTEKFCFSRRHMIPKGINGFLFFMGKLHYNICLCCQLRYCFTEA